ncbi:MAG TPA: hypothetical protein ENJ82_14775, partial [Bacteroidetes bacterium]|nr:hypothetical protein [Bacteroidota bacterium]
MKITATIKRAEQWIGRFYYSPKYSKWVFLLAMILVSLALHFTEVFPLRPQGMHQWRQADCLSITQNFYEGNNGFFTPGMHFLGASGTGNTMSEFPIIYYTVAQLWKLFGPHEWIFRAVNLALFFLGMLALFRTLETLLKDSFMGLSVVILLFTSPMLAYYANNFLANVPAFSMALIAWYMFMRHIVTNKRRFLFLALLFFTLGGLLKITSIISFVGLTVILALEFLGITKFDKKGILLRSSGKILLFF